jgi:hypothetical protein
MTGTDRPLFCAGTGVESIIGRGFSPVFAERAKLFPLQIGCDYRQ